MADSDSQPTGRRGRRLSDVPLETLHRLATGESETGNWTEWMAADMPRLARTVADECGVPALTASLRRAADHATGLGILRRLFVFGQAVSEAFTDFSDAGFHVIAAHRSDVVRQWGAYAVNDGTRSMKLADRCALTRRFASDGHMSVRECAWMAFRPHLARQLPQGLRLLEKVSKSDDANERRFAVEVCRPRSVWGSHLGPLKREPSQAIAILENVRRDGSRYVRLAVGNWLNDASKSRPDWVREICSRWLAEDNRNTTAIVARGLRTLNRQTVGDVPLLAATTASSQIGGEGGFKC